MKRITGHKGDIFKPKGQLKREIDLAERHAERVVEILGDFVSEERAQFFDRVIQSRIRKLTVAVDGVTDPHNTAAVIRTAEAFGMQTVHIVENGTPFQSSRRVTRGTHKWIDFAVWKTPSQFADAVKGEGKRILTAEAGAAVPLDELDPNIPTALVFGNEKDGISEEMRALSDGNFYIPMDGFAESLNVSVAAAVSIHSLCRRISGDLSPREQSVLKARYYLLSVRAGYDIAVQAIGGAVAHVQVESSIPTAHLEVYVALRPGRVLVAAWTMLEQQLLLSGRGLQ